jgi:hypothetical protein
MGVVEGKSLHGYRIGMRINGVGGRIEKAEVITG